MDINGRKAEILNIEKLEYSTTEEWLVYCDTNHSQHYSAIKTSGYKDHQYTV